MKLIPIPAAAEQLGLSPNTLRRMIDRGEFIDVIQISPNRVAVSEDDLDVWIASRPRGWLTHPKAGA